MSESRQSNAMCVHSFSKDRLFPATLKRPNRCPRNPLCNRDLAFSQKRSGPSVINLSSRTYVRYFKKEESCAIEVFVRIAIPTERKEKESEIIFNAREKARVSGLFGNESLPPSLR